MAAPLRGSCAALAKAFEYPAPARPGLLHDSISALPEGPAREHYVAFVKSIDRLSPGEWEELYTRTLDLNPLVAPYIGFHIWGESYRRGPFLGRMNRALSEAGIGTEGELPDHIAAVLRYLAAAPTPPPELTEMLGPALDHMIATLRAAEPHNPYVELFLAVEAIRASLQEKEAA